MDNAQVMTSPRLLALRCRSRHLHPTMRDHTELDSDSKLFNYNSDMELPEWSNKEGILQFLGVNEEMSRKILLKYRTVYDLDPQPLNKSLQIPYRKSPYVQPGEVDREPTMVTYGDIPLVEHLVKLYGSREDDLSPEYYKFEETYDSYINSGMKGHGLRPDFAIRCGIHLDETAYDKGKKRSGTRMH